MKTKLVLFLASITLAGVSYAGPSESANTVRRAQELINQANSSVVVAASDSSSRVYSAPSGRGVVHVPTSDAGATNVALFKSSAKGSCEGGACCAKK